MKTIKQLLITIVALLCSTTASAYDFEVDGIYYNITSITDLTAEVTNGDNEYSDKVIIPETVVYKSKVLKVTSISPYAFNGCNNLTSVVIGNNVTSIIDETFSQCSNLTSVVTGNSVTSIGESAFYKCSNLTNVVIGNSVTSIGDGAFSSCARLTSVTIGNSVTSIGSWAFGDCSGLTSIEIPNSVTSIGNAAFYGTAWYNNQPGGVVYAGKVLYKYKGTMPENTSVEVKAGTLGIAGSAFAGCYGLTSIEIPNSVTSIGEGAFEGCSGLTSIEIPNSVTSIGDYAFYGCSGLKSVTSLIPADKLFEIPSNTFLYSDIPCLYVPYGAKEAYASTSGWSAFTNIVELEPETTEVTITINQYGSATYCSPFALDFSNVEGIKAYSAIGYKPSTQVVTLARVMTAGAGQGVFIKGEPGEYTVPVIDNFDEYTLNMLVGTLEQTTVNATDGTMSNYKFTIAEGDEAPMFYPFEDNTTFSAGKAYLQIPTAWLTAAAQKSVSVRFDDGETTGVDEIAGECTEGKNIYDLQGRKINDITESGIYIIDGKRVFVK